MTTANDNRYQDVYYHQYCAKCKHYEKELLKEQCEHCMDNPLNLYSHKPVNFEEPRK